MLYLGSFLNLKLAANIIDQSAKQACGSNCGNSSLGSLIGQATNAVIYLVGALAVIMIIWGGLQFVFSTGDPGRQKKARETVIYAVVGVIVAIISFALVNFVIDKLG